MEDNERPVYTWHQLLVWRLGDIRGECLYSGYDRNKALQAYISALHDSTITSISYDVHKSCLRPPELRQTGELAL